MIEKKTWMPFFQWMKMGRKKMELRIADFPLEEGDTITFREYDQFLKVYTGRTLKKRVKTLFKIRLTDFNTIEEIKKHGHYLMELEDEEEAVK